MTKQFFAKVAAVAMIIAGSLLGSGIAYAQNRAISGTVVDASGAPVVGAAVVVVGNASIGTSKSRLYMRSKGSIRPEPHTGSQPPRNRCHLS